MTLSNSRRAELARMEEDRTCPLCDGDGCDPGNDYVLPCPACGGEGTHQ